MSSSAPKLRLLEPLATESLELKEQESSHIQQTQFWFVVGSSSKMRGPFSTKQLIEELEKKTLTFGDYCWRQGFGDWRVIASQNEFSHLSSAVEVGPYPQVLPPGGYGVLKNTSSSKEKDSTKGFVELRLQKQGIRSWGVYEWSLVLFLCLGFSFLTMWTVFRELDFKIGAGLALKQQGTWQEDPSSQGAMRSYEIAPMLSAPSLLTFDKSTAWSYFQFDPELKQDLFQEEAVSEKKWNVQSRIDPVYRRPTNQRGYLVIDKKLKFLGRPLIGEPYLFEFHDPLEPL